MSDGPISYSMIIAIEIVGIIMVAIGFGIEIYRAAEIGYIVISVGSILISIGSILWGKIFKFKKEEKNEHNTNT